MYPVAFRSAVLRAYEHIHSIRKLSTIFGVGAATICRWKKQIQPQTGQYIPKVDKHMMLFIRNILTEKPFLTCSALGSAILHVFGVKVSRQLLAISIRKCGMSRKRTRSRALPNMDTNEYINSKRTFHHRFIKAIQEGKCVAAIDETSFNDVSLPLYGYSPLGRRLVVHHRRRSWMKMSTVAAITTSGARYFNTVNGSHNRGTFETFLSTLDFPSSSVLVIYP